MREGGLLMTFQFAPGIPKKVQVADDMRRKIATGTWTQGQSVGDMFKLAGQYGCSFGTIREAEEILVREGLLSEIRMGIPTRVIATPAAPGWTDVLRKLRAAHRALGEAITAAETTAGMTAHDPGTDPRPPQ
jgi:DNA-binding FadR family transcriptional regulator